MEIQKQKWTQPVDTRPNLYLPAKATVDGLQPRWGGGLEGGVEELGKVS